MFRKTFTQQMNLNGGISAARGSNLKKTAAWHQGHAAYLHPAYSAEVPPEAVPHLQEAALLWLAKYTNHPPQSSRGTIFLLLNPHPAITAGVKLVCSSFKLSSVHLREQLQQQPPNKDNLCAGPVHEVHLLPWLPPSK